MVIVIVLVPPSSSTTAKRSVWTPAHCPKTEKIKPLDYARSSRGLLLGKRRALPTRMIGILPYSDELSSRCFTFGCSCVVVVEAIPQNYEKRWYRNHPL